MPREYKNILIIIGVLVILIVVSSSYFLKRWSAGPSLIPNTRIFPTDVASQVASNFRVVHQDPNDPLERTLIYNSGNTNVYYDGYGKLKAKGGREYVIGAFDQWKDIDGGNDRLLVLHDPVNKILLGEYHVIFQPTRISDTAGVVTELGVEDLSLAREGTSLTDTIDINWTRELNQVEENTLKTYIKKGDVLIIFPYSIYTNKIWKISLDTNNVSYVSMIVMRRQNGSKDLE